LQEPLEAQRNPTPAHGGRKFIIASNSHAMSTYQPIQRVSGGSKPSPKIILQGYLVSD